MDSSYGDRGTTQWRVKRSGARVLVFISCQKRKLSEVHGVANTCLLVKETIKKERKIKRRGIGGSKTNFITVWTVQPRDRLA